jgi:hypothetical protein
MIVNKNRMIFKRLNNRNKNIKNFFRITEKESHFTNKKTLITKNKNKKKKNKNI